MAARVAVEDRLNAVLSAGAVRMRLSDALKAGCLAAGVLFAAMAVLILLQRVCFLGAPAAGGFAGFLKLPEWMTWTFAGLAVLPLLVAMFSYLRSDHGVLSAALAADERLGLRARLSSAVAFDVSGGGSGVMGAALLADARGCAAAIEVSREFPLAVPTRLWAMPPAAGALLLGALVLPQADLLDRRVRLERAAAEREDVTQAAAAMQRKLAELNRRPEDPPPSDRQPSEQLKDEMSKLVAALKENADRDSAAARLNKLFDEAKIAEQRLAGMERFVRQMEQINKLGKLPEGMQKGVGGAMARGDFKASAEELKKLAEQLKDNKLSREEEAALKRELERLAKMTEDWKELSDELARAAAKLGDGKDQEAYEEMLAASEDLKELAELLRELDPEGKGAAAALGAEGERVRLDEEMIRQLKDTLKNARRCVFCRKIYCLTCGRPRCACEGEEQCDCQPGEGEGKAAAVPVPVPAGMGQGSGAGSSGTGAGGNGAGGSGAGTTGTSQGAPPEPMREDVKREGTKVTGKVDLRGGVVGHMWTRGAPGPKDDTKKAEYQAAHEAAARAAAEAVDSGRIPRELREYVRNYFDTTRTRPSVPGETVPDKAPSPQAPAGDKGAN